MSMDVDMSIYVPLEPKGLSEERQKKIMDEVKSDESGICAVVYFDENVTVIENVLMVEIDGKLIAKYKIINVRDLKLTRAYDVVFLEPWMEG